MPTLAKGKPDATNSTTRRTKLLTKQERVKVIDEGAEIFGKGQASLLLQAIPC